MQPDSRLCFRARYLLPIATAPIEDGALLVEDGRIAAVGAYGELRSFAAEPVDFGDAVILPPLVNAHTHLELTHFPLWALEAGEGEPPADFVDWILYVIRVKRRRKPEDFAPSVAAGIAESLRAGTGAAGEILSWFPARQIHRASPLKGRIFFETLGRDPEVGRRLLRTIIDLAQEGRIGSMDPGLAPHSPYSLSAEYLEEIFDAARRSGLPATIHLGESPAEKVFLRDGRGPIAERLYPFVGWGVPPAPHRSPVSYLAQRGGLGPRNLAAHGVQVGAEDIALLVQSGSPLVLCPRSNARLQVGKAPLSSYLRAGVPLALGTDSRASCDTLSVWDEIAFARSWFAGEASAETLLDMATRGGAHSLGLDTEMGTLQAGLGAHFQVLTPPSLPPLAQLADFLCSPGRTADVCALYLDGRDVLQTP